MPDDLGSAVDTVLSRCLAVREGERVVVVSDTATQRLGEALHAGAAAAGAESVLAVMKPRQVDGQEPPDAVAAALAAAERGANILRVHDVAETRDALAVWQAVRNA